MFVSPEFAACSMLHTTLPSRQHSKRSDAATSNANAAARPAAAIATQNNAATLDFTVCFMTPLHTLNRLLCPKRIDGCRSAD
eukprot:scaffold592681_cov46-Prasinocladus_malaysianus.AAC.1